MNIHARLAEMMVFLRKLIEVGVNGPAEDMEALFEEKPGSDMDFLQDLVALLAGLFAESENKAGRDPIQSCLKLELYGRLQAQGGGRVGES